MKLLRYGEKGQERPALLDNDGQLRDLSAVVADIAGQTLSPESIARLQDIDPSTLPLVEGSPVSAPASARSENLSASA